MFYDKKKKNDIFIWSVITILIFSSFSFFYYFSNYLLITRSIAIAVSCFLSLALFTNTSLGKSYFEYVKESLKEVNSITWPNKKDTIQTTLVILGLVVFIFIILCLIDIVFFEFIKWAANFG